MSRSRARESGLFGGESAARADDVVGTEIVWGAVPGWLAAFVPTVRGGLMQVCLLLPTFLGVSGTSAGFTFITGINIGKHTK